MEKTFAILGAGMQGTAAAYDLAQFAGGAPVVLADASLARAQQAADRVNTLVGRAACRASAVDALDAAGLGAFLVPVDVLLSCVPYWMHPRIAEAAIASGTNMCDLGGNTEVTLETLAKDARAREAGVTLIPDTGLAPGLVNSIGRYLIDRFDEAESVRLFCGVLPQHPVPPFNYKLTFNIEGLVTEYEYQAVRLRNGEIERVDTLAELEEIELDGLGKMEAFTTSGGTSTAPYTFQGRVRDYEYKTIRFPGHCERMRIFKDFGFWDEQPVDVKGCSVAPRDVFYRVFGERLAAIKDVDQCIVRGIGIGTVNGERRQIQVDIHDRQCESTGFSSMERTTGFSIAIHAIALARGMVPPGAVRYENALDGGSVLEELRNRGVEITERSSAIS
jgi:lysine 6-dehydrogenase